MNARIHDCLVKIKHSDVLQDLIVECWENREGWYLVIPLDDFPGLPLAREREWMLAIQPEWIEPVNRADCGVLCREVIDLDRFHELPWTPLRM